ncbi:MAG TPA: cell division protein FtsZ [Verrucomicrobiae bacterium]|nr:cell division protein FtsZ [Verrucomicrobiae bacterium]
MQNDPQIESSMESAKSIRLKIFGVGNAGVKILEHIARNGAPGAELIAVNTETDSLNASSAAEKISLETKLTRGLGTGGDPERGRVAAEENSETLKNACNGADIVFVVTGLGGGAGTGISPFLSQMARDAGALVLAFGVTPFDCEGNCRQRQARQGFKDLKAAADGVICMPNQNLFRLMDENTSVMEMFERANELLAETIANVSRLITSKGLIELRFADLCGFLRERHSENQFATAEAAGATRSRDMMEKLLAHPFLDGGKTLAESDAVFVSLIGGPDLTMADINRVMEPINGKCGRAQVIMGAAIDEKFQERLAVTIIAARHVDAPTAKAAEESARGESPAAGPELNTQIHRAPTTRPNSRFVPPPPSMTPEQMEKFMGRQTPGATRARKSSNKMRQGTLPLEIVSKGRFDKSEPTIHKGEDLDIPTYIRRGVALN